MKYFGAILFLFLLSASAFAQENCILIRAHNIRSGDGVIRYAVYTPEQKFTGYDVFAEGYVDAKEGTTTFLIKDIPNGEYGIAILHDENNDGDMNYSLGIPKEGFGFSNDAKVKMAPPKFKDASFIKNGELMLTIKIRYML
ncbi:MAG TPA: DUF2141 domain-containing protein [Bacteroidales bacterium]|jgi:uncharacterized protein (DUF2141 family)|nr:DUF2141 domain-containing protein [Bacteroidales bacterium]MDD4234391.1 DUF2141 domain-containing protein [Bacteroidales bacterium]MDY0160052.1 DUF2141 domain-containing protein [Bacteroidales bacterium]HRW20336.1 DUF2141 domain-containing protein [Bacteroidales bacterium]HXK80739.1 DUF2141 domain-containing protein [Bacteroidales bacterium]